MEDDFEAERDDRLGELERALGCTSSSAPGDGYSEGREEGWGREALDAVEEVGYTRRGAGREELERVEWPFPLSEEGGQVRHGWLVSRLAGCVVRARTGELERMDTLR